MKKHEIIDDRWVLHNLIRRDGYFLARVRDMRTGKTQYYSTRKTVEREAKAAARLWIKRLAEEEKAPKHMSFEVAYKAFLALKVGRVRDQSLENLERDAARLYYPVLGALGLSAIRYSDIEAWHKGLEARGQVGSTQRLHVNRLSSFFKWAIKHEYMQRNFARDLPKIQVQKTRRTVLTPEQARTFFAGSMPDAVRLAVLIALHTGLRKKNVLGNKRTTGLEWGEVDLAKRRIFIVAKRMKSKRDFETGIHPELYAELRKLSFLDPKAMVLPTKHLEKPFAVAIARAGLPHMRWHDLRHTFCTWCAGRVLHGMGQALMDHAAKDMTDHYTHVPFEGKLAAIDQFPPLLSSQDPGTLCRSQGT